MSKEFDLGCKSGIRKGRKQIINNIKKHYREDNWSPPQYYGGIDSIAVSLPTSTLIKYFKEVKDG